MQVLNKTVSMNTESDIYGSHSQILSPFKYELPYGYKSEDGSNIKNIPNDPYAQQYIMETGAYDEAKKQLFNSNVQGAPGIAYYSVDYVGQGVPPESSTPRAKFSNIFDASERLPYHPNNFFDGKPFICSYDFDPQSPGPMMQFMVDGIEVVALGRKACDDIKNYINAYGAGAVTKLTIPFNLQPTVLITGGNIPLFPACAPNPLCWEGCIIADNENCGCSQPEACIPHKIHKYYVRFFIFATFIYEYKLEGKPVVYVSPPSPYIISRTPIEDFEREDAVLELAVYYTLPGVTRVRYWLTYDNRVWCAPSENEPGCSPKCEGPCPGPELPPINFQEGDFRLIGEAVISNEWYQPPLWWDAVRADGLLEQTNLDHLNNLSK